MSSDQGKHDDIVVAGILEKSKSTLDLFPNFQVLSENPPALRLF